MKYFQRLFSVLLIAGMLLGWTTSGSILASSQLTPRLQNDATQKFEPLLLNQLAAGPADFFVVMADKADLSGAASLQTKAEKGQYVFTALTTIATKTQADLRAYLDRQGVSYKPYYIVNTIFIKGGTLDLANTIAARPDVKAINSNHTYKLAEPVNPQASPTDPQAVEPNITFVKADQVWALGITGQGTVVAGNDTGLDETHPAIARHYRGCVNPPTCTEWDHNFNWWDPTGTYPTNPYDGFGHGTHTTGTMVGDDGAGNQIGMAPGAKTIHCKLMDDGGYATDQWIEECFQWDLAPWDLNGENADPLKAPDSVNNSWGWPGGDYNGNREETDALLAAGIVAEFSAGNEGPTCSSLRSPGDYVEVFTTGSVNHSGGQLPGTLTGFSSRGPSGLDEGYFPDFMAPGENIRSSLPGGAYAYWGGTSMAGPHVTALIGLMWSANPALRGLIQPTYDIIRDTVIPLTGQNGSNCGGDYEVGPNNDWGYGTIDALAAVQMAIAMGGAGKLDGTVTDADTGNPVQGANILAEHSAGWAWDINTNVDGYYTTTVAAGTFTVTASAEGYESKSVYPVKVVTDTVTTQDFVLKYIPNVAMSPDVQTQTAAPGAQVSYVYTVTNDAHLPQEISLDLESKWPTQAPSTTGILAPEETVLIPVTVTIPTMPDVIIASDTFTLTAVGSENPEFIAFVTGTTKANVTPGVMVAAPANQNGIPNQVINYEFTLTNTGNYTDSFTLSAFGLWPSSVPGGDQSVPLPPGASTTVTVAVAVPADVEVGDTCITTFRAVSGISRTVRSSAHVTSTAAEPVYYTLLPFVRR